MWVADVLGVSLEEGLWTSAFWHIADAPTGWKLAFIIGQTPQPTYYALQLVATHFTGRTIAPAGVPAGFSVYASRDAAAGKTAVLILNKTGAAARLALAFDAQPAAQAVGLAAQSMALAVFTDGAAAPQITRYTQDLADAGLPPAQEP